MAGTDSLDRSIPDELLDEYVNLGIEGTNKLSKLDYRGAVESYSKQFELLLSAQHEYKRTIHKGAALYYVGVANTYNKDYDQAIWHFSMAYIEDMFSTRIGYERDAGEAPAAKAVADLYEMDEEIIAKMSKAVRKIKKRVVEGLQDLTAIANPQDILLTILKRLRIDRNKLLSKCRQKQPEVTLLEIQQPWSRRVFIGGNYDSPGYIFAIADLVRANGYIPKLACEVTMMPDLQRKNIHDGSLMLLHTCRYAIFEVTTYSGWLMELERTRDYGIKKVLLLRNTMDPKNVNKNISSMIKSMGMTPRPFKTAGDIEPIIHKFLPKLEA